MPEGLENPGPVVILRTPNYPPRHVRWGQPWQVGTAAYWIGLTHAYALESRLPTGRPVTKDALVEEVAACLLGGYGVHHETALAAFEALRSCGLLSGPSEPPDIERVLTSPLHIAGRTVRYRFPVQKSAYLSSALHRLHTSSPPTTARELRNWLLELPGIGPKTSGWIVRNLLGSDSVGIIDIHILRAGVEAGVFEESWTPAHHYAILEELFLAWAAAGGVGAGDLDAVVWSERATARRAY